MFVGGRDGRAEVWFNTFRARKKTETVECNGMQRGAVGVYIEKKRWTDSEMEEERKGAKHGCGHVSMVRGERNLWHPMSNNGK